MRLQKILLIMPNSGKSKQVGYSEKMTMPPLGIVSIGGYLKIHGYDVKILDMFTNKMMRAEFIEYLRKEEPDFVGISTYTETYRSVIKLTKLIKEIIPKTIVVLGGAHVTFMPEEALSEPSVDFVSRGEGEVTFSELLEHFNFGTIDLTEIDGLSYRKNGKIKHTSERRYIINLDSLPWTDLSEDELDHYKIKQLIITSRGCPGKCIYCASAALSGTRYRARSAENVFSEIYYKYYAKGEDYFAFLDDTFTANKKRLYKFCDYVERAKLNIIWRCDSRTDILDNDMIDRVWEVGCRSIHIGVESGSQEVINKINKHINLKKTEDLLEYMSNKGMQVMCTFILGHHCDTHETIRETIDIAIRFKKKYNAVVGLSINTPFPGTYLYNHMKDLGITLEVKNWTCFDLVQAVFSTTNLSREEIQNYYFEIQQLVL